MPKEEKRKFTRRQKIGLVLLALTCTAGLAGGIYFACRPGDSHPKSKHGGTTDSSPPTPLDSDVGEGDLLPTDENLPTPPSPGPVVTSLDQFTDQLGKLTTGSEGGISESVISNFLTTQQPFIKKLTSDQNWNLLTNTAKVIPTLPAEKVPLLVGDLFKASKVVDDRIVSIPTDWSSTLFDTETIANYLKGKMESKKEDFSTYKPLLRAIWPTLKKAPPSSTSTNTSTFTSKDWYPYDELVVLQSTTATNEQIIKACQFIQKNGKDVAQEAFEKITLPILQAHSQTLYNELKDYPIPLVYLLQQFKKHSVPFTGTYKIANLTALDKDSHLATLYLGIIEDEVKKDILQNNFSTTVGQELGSLILENPVANAALLDKIPIGEITLVDSEILKAIPISNQLFLFLKNNLPWNPNQLKVFGRVVQENKNKPFVTQLAQQFVLNPQMVKGIAEPGSTSLPLLQVDSLFRRELFFHLANETSAWLELKQLDGQFINNFLSTIGSTTKGWIDQFSDPYLKDSHIGRITNLPHVAELFQVQNIEPINSAEYSQLKTAISTRPPTLSYTGTGELGLEASGKSNSCFFNSLTQTLLHTPELGLLLCNLSNELLTVGYSSVIGKTAVHTTRFNVVSQFITLYHNYWNPTGSGVSAIGKVDFYDALYLYFQATNSRFAQLAEGNQEDAHEYLIAIIECFNEFIVDVSTSHPQLSYYLLQLRHLYGVRLINKIKFQSTCINPALKDCFRIPQGEFRQEEERFIGLQFPPSKQTGTVTLDEMMQYLQSKSYTEECENCKKVATVDSQIKFDYLPKILTISLVRHKYTKEKGPVKINTQISFSPGFRFTLEGKTFQIYLFIRHAGGMDQGHYVSGWFNSGTGVWHLFNDSRHAILTSNDTVIDQMSNAYLFIARQV